MDTTVDRQARRAALADFTPNISNVHHIAYKCRDAEETRHFYEDILGLKFVAALEDAIPPGPGLPPTPFIHVFFEMSSGECIAFFDLGDNRAPERDAHTPFFVNHLSMEVPDEASLLAMQDRLKTAGVEVYYLKDHDFCVSIYFSDPSGNRLEISYNTPTYDQYWTRETASAPAALATWQRRKKERSVEPNPKS